MVIPYRIEHDQLARRSPGIDLRWPASAIWRDGEPGVRKISLDDLRNALARGIDDFKAMPSHAIFLCLFYPLIGLMLFRVVFGYGMVQMIYPLLFGLVLVGPVAAIGLYELSRRRESGLETSIGHAFDVLRTPAIGSIALLGLLLLAIFVCWLLAAQAMYTQAFGANDPASAGAFLNDMFSTPAGRRLLVAGNVVGALFAAVTLMISVVSFPMLVDRPVGAGTAVRTSIRAVIENPVVMGVWGLIVATALLIGSIPLLFGLALVLPVLGHATWHLYRRVVDPA
jgi:uncharacterized membrane protein